MVHVPILLYHSISADPAPVIRPFAVSPETFSQHLDAIAASGVAPLSVSEFVAARDADRLPPRVAVVTFDDGFADFADAALPALRARGLPATLYVATALLGGRPWSVSLPALATRMLDWDRLQELADAGVEVGAHSHTHPHLDTLSRKRAGAEIERSKQLLEDELQRPVRSFAYPNGYSTPHVRRLVEEAGFDSACAVRNGFSSADDDRYALARLTVRSSTGAAEVAAWLEGAGAGPAPSPERVATRLWRLYRRTRAIGTRRPGSDLR